jgi:hypothetical protein
MPTELNAGDLSILPLILRNSEPDSKEYQQAKSLMTTLMQQADQLKAEDDQQSEPEPQQPEPQQPEPQQPVAQQPVAQPSIENPEEQPITEAVMTDEELAAEFEKRLQDPKDLSWMVDAAKSDPAFEDRIVSMKAKHLQTYRSGQQAGQEEEFKINKEAFESIAKLALKLTRKVSGSLTEIKKAYDEQIARGDYIISKENDISIDDPPIRIKPKSINSEVKKELLDVITDMFSRPLTSAETITDRDRRKTILVDFMQNCVEGIINFEELLKARRGNVLIELSAEKQEVVNMIGNILLVKPSATAGNWGPGELGLAILGTPVHKGKTGDLNVNGKDIELKASQNPEKGGRLGTIALNKGDAGYSIYERALKSLFSNAGYKPEDLDFSLKSKEEVSEQRVKKVKELKKSVLPNNNVGVYVDEKGNEKDIKWTSFGKTFIEKALNPKIKDRVGVEMTKQFLATVATSCLIERYKKKFGGDWDTSFVDECVESDGTINYDAFATGYAKMLYDIYQIVDGKGEIMVLNPNSGSYYVMLSSDDFDEAITPDQGYQPIRVGSVAIDFTDSQGKASPQIGIA